MSKAPTTTIAPVDGRTLLRAIKKFQRESLAGAYYAPFNMNSKNYMFIPPETEAWFNRLGELLVASVQWYRMFAAKKPVMLYDIQEQLIYAYPYREFKAELSQRSQAMLEDQYRRAVIDDKMVVFVRDNEQRRLVSYSFDIEEK